MGMTVLLAMALVTLLSYAISIRAWEAPRLRIERDQLLVARDHLYKRLGRAQMAILPLPRHHQGPTTPLPIWTAEEEAETVLLPSILPPPDR